MDAFVSEWAASVGYDYVLYRDDITGSIAHAKMLAKQGIITEEDAQNIEAGLNEILADIEDGKMEWSADNEDVHMNIEALLTEKIGEAGKRLHTARSRNDQVATDIRLFTKNEILEVARLLASLRRTVVNIAKDHTLTIMPGYTHMQHAQPVSLGFHMMAYYQMFTRDADRFWDIYKRVDFLPLGSGAMSGTTYDTDRQFLADELGFAHLCVNAMDAVSDRDFIIEFLSASSITMMHLSRFCEELILWSSSEFGFVEMDDSFSTGSSIMPQKKNPDMAELIRGKVGRVYGDLFSLLTTMKSLPLAYNKDMQEDKEPLFDASNTVQSCLKVFTDMLASARWKPANMQQMAERGFMNATDAADYLVTKGLPFREAHAVIGKIVAYCVDEKINIEDVPLGKLQEFSELFDNDIFEKIDLTYCMNAKLSKGSTARKEVELQILAAENDLD
jgi:argininosuccinate lyase